MAEISDPIEAPVVFGAYVDGLFDATWSGRVPFEPHSPRIRSVIFPAERGAPPLAGELSLQSREDLGLPWPPDARVDANRPPRRVPVPLLWQGLTQRRDGAAAWQHAAGSVTFADLLAAHITASLPSSAKLTPSYLAIPDALSEFSQQRLLDALRRLGWRKLQLIWAPVALALAWLDAVQDSFEIDDGRDRLVVLNVAGGWIDCTTFTLTTRAASKPLGVSAGTSSERFTVPIRRPSSLASRLTGFDLVAARIAGLARTMGLTLDLQSEWYALSLPALWLGYGPQHTEDDFLWYPSRNWQPVPQRILTDPADPDLVAAPSLRVEAFLAQGCQIARSEREASSWGELLRTILSDAIGSAPEAVRGVIVAGLPSQSSDHRWLEAVEQVCPPRFKGRCHADAAPDAIWSPDDSAMTVARGACLFGQRQQAGLPTYLETLPNLDVLAETDQGPNWVPLVRDDTTDGGRPYQRTLKGGFALDEGRAELEAYLRMQDGDVASTRLTTFHFPRGPSRRMPLDVRIEIRPAGGLAIVEMLPEDPTFLGGVQVYLDYREMTEVDAAVLVDAAGDLDCPPITPSHVETDDPYAIHLLRRDVTVFLGTPLHLPTTGAAYDKALRNLQVLVSRPRRILGAPRGQVHRFIDVEGKAATPAAQVLIENLSKRLGQDFARSVGFPSAKKVTKSLLTTGAWLFGAAPESIRRHIVADLEATQTTPKSSTVNAAGRVLLTEQDIRGFFIAMHAHASRANRGGRRFPIYWLYSAKRLLSCHEVAARALSRDHAIRILEFLVHDLQSVPVSGNVFPAALRVIFYLLRYRRIDGSFLSATSAQDAAPRAALIDCVDNTIATLPSAPLAEIRKVSLRDALVGLKQFLDYKGSMNIVRKLAELGDDDDDYSDAE